MKTRVPTFGCPLPPLSPLPSPPPPPLSLSLLLQVAEILNGSPTFLTAIWQIRLLNKCYLKHSKILKCNQFALNLIPSFPLSLMRATTEKPP